MYKAIQIQYTFCHLLQQQAHQQGNALNWYKNDFTEFGALFHFQHSGIILSELY